ncbi:MAG TPA: SDR family oxidoreductase [Gemmatimonadaceae bacterium]|nr:SDR family oxidoreductase [Gemmatimonadaceae bacterium]
MTEVNLSGRTAVVTGASSGIGLATAKALVGSGAHVALLARNRDKLQRAADAMGGDAFIVRCDLLDENQISEAARLIGTRFGGAPDILVLNAGVFALGKVGEMPPEEFAQTITLNLIAPYRLLFAFVPAMRQRGAGHIVTIGSIADRVTYPENAAYAAAKFGARGLHQVLRTELVRTGVRASLISPGPVDTALWDPIDPDSRPGFSARDEMLHADAVADAVRWVVTRPAGVNIDELRLTRT